MALGHEVRHRNVMALGESQLSRLSVELSVPTSQARLYSVPCGDLNSIKEASNQKRVVMRNFLIHTTLAFFVCVVSLTLSQQTQSAQSKQPQDHTRVLTGRVFGRQDQPLAKAVVYLKNTKSLVVKTYISDNDGTYRFPNLSPNVDYEVYAEYQGGRSDTKTLSAFDNRKLANITLRVK